MAYVEAGLRYTRVRQAVSHSSATQHPKSHRPMRAACVVAFMDAKQSINRLYRPRVPKQVLELGKYCDMISSANPVVIYLSEQTCLATASQAPDCAGPAQAPGCGVLHGRCSRTGARHPAPDSRARSHALHGRRGGGRSTSIHFSPVHLLHISTLPRLPPLRCDARLHGDKRQRRQQRRRRRGHQQQRQ